MYCYCQGEGGPRGEIHEMTAISGLHQQHDNNHDAGSRRRGGVVDLIDLHIYDEVARYSSEEGGSEADSEADKLDQATGGIDETVIYVPTSNVGSVSSFDEVTLKEVVRSSTPTKKEKKKKSKADVVSGGVYENTRQKETGRRKALKSSVFMSPPDTPSEDSTQV